jgi:hypothetical protein
VLFLALHRVVTSHDCDLLLGQESKEQEDRLFGEDGFERTVDRVAKIKRRLAITGLVVGASPWSLDGPLGRRFQRRG